MSSSALETRSIIKEAHASLSGEYPGYHLYFDRLEQVKSSIEALGRISEPPVPGVFVSPGYVETMTASDMVVSDLSMQIFARAGDVPADEIHDMVYLPFVQPYYVSLITALERYGMIISSHKKVEVLHDRETPADAVAGYDLSFGDIIINKKKCKK